jgi:hypothetical protein
VITLQAYWMGRDETDAGELTPDIRDNAQRTVTRWRALLEITGNQGLEPPIGGWCWASGWRPADVNARTPGGAAFSKHRTGEAGDVRDAVDRRLARWCLQNLDVLDAIGLWMERPQWTPTWVHLQIVPPRSGKRVFIPNNNPPSVPPLPGEV